MRTQPEEREGGVRAEVLALEVNLGERELVREEIRLIDRVEVNDLAVLDHHRLKPGQELAQGGVDNAGVCENEAGGGAGDPWPESELGKSVQLARRLATLE